MGQNGFSSSFCKLHLGSLFVLGEGIFSKVAGGVETHTQQQNKHHPTVGFLRGTNWQCVATAARPGLPKRAKRRRINFLWRTTATKERQDGDRRKTAKESKHMAAAAFHLHFVVHCCIGCCCCCPYTVLFLLCCSSYNIPGIVYSLAAAMASESAPICSRARCSVCRGNKG